jgi:hypothetical protein
MRRPATTVSRKVLVPVVGLCLLVSAVLIPVGAHLPRWIEAEIVLVVWWLVWTCALSWLLVKGHAVDDDTRMNFGGDKTDAVMGAFDFGELGGCWFGEGCTSVVLALFAALLIGLAFVLVIEFIVPAIAILLLLSIGGMLARAVNDTHDCRGRFGLSLMWGVVWSTIYIGPILVLVLSVSSFLSRHA